MGSPNMNLTVPAAGITPSPTWANNITNDLNIIDAHNHTPGNGAPITVDAIAITKNLSFGAFSATNLASAVFLLQSALTTPQAIYVSGSGDLYYNNSGGTAVQITAGSSVNATSSGLRGGANQLASFSSNTLQVFADTTTSPSTPANVQAANLLLGSGTSGFYVTVSPPSLTSNYGLTLPSIPAQPLFVTIDTSGNLSTASSIQTPQIAVGAIAGIQIGNGQITGTQIVSGVVLSGSPTVPGSGSGGAIATGPASHIGAGAAPLIQYATISSAGSLIQTLGVSSASWSGGTLTIHFSGTGGFTPAIVANSDTGGVTFAVTSVTTTSATLLSSSATAHTCQVIIISVSQ